MTASNARPSKGPLLSRGSVVDGVVGAVEVDDVEVDEDVEVCGTSVVLSSIVLVVAGLVVAGVVTGRSVLIGVTVDVVVCAVAAWSSRARGAAMSATTAAHAAPITQTFLAIRLHSHRRTAHIRCIPLAELQSPSMSVVTPAQINDFLSREFATSGSRCEAVSEGWAVAHLRADAMVLRPGGIISGPTIFALCDAALYYACFTVIGIEPMAVTSEMSIRFLRPARGSEIRARADLQDVGRRSLVGSVIAWTDSIDKPVAVAQGTYVRPRPHSPAPG
jgi:uncharacterized protein (TIGR00369 family)